MVLRGPQRGEMLALFEEARARGGVPVAYLEEIRLHLLEDRPRAEAAEIPDVRLLQRVVIERGRVTLAEAFGADADLFLVMEASDRSGKIGRTRARVWITTLMAGSG